MAKPQIEDGAAALAVAQVLVRVMQGNFDGRPVRAIVVAEIGQLASALVLGRGGDEETAARAQRKIHEGAAAILGVP